MRSNRKFGARHLIGRLAIAATALTCHFAAADPSWPLKQTFNIGIGAFFLGTDTTVRVDGTASTGRVIGTEFNIDDEFGFNNQNRLRVDGFWRFADRHKLRFLYFDSRSDKTRNLDRDIEFRGMLFPVSSSVRGEFKSQVIELAYEYAFVHRDSWELAGTIGLHNLKIEASLNAQISSTSTATQVSQSADAKGNGPFPVVGLHGTWAFGDHWYLDAQAQYFQISAGDYDGSLQDYKLGIVWMPWRNFGVGVAYNDFTTHLRVDANNFKGSLRYGYNGPLGFITVAF